MEDFARRISIQTEGTNNVLVIELQPGEMLIPYCCKVMERNNIPGLLRMRHQSMDGVIRLRYSIGGKIPLREFMLRNHLNYSNGIRLLRNLCDALLHLNEYFLTVDMCYLDPEQIYVGDGLCIYLPCVPVQRDTVPNSAARLKQFFEKLLSEYFATADCNSYDDMFKWVYRATLFDLETFRRTFLQEEKSTPAANPAPRAPEVPKAAPVPEPQEENHELTELLQEKMQGLKSIYPGVEALQRAVMPDAGKDGNEPPKQEGGMSFAIPGGGSFAIPGMDRKPKPKPEKEHKGFWPFGARSEKEQPEPPEVMPQPVPAAPKPRAAAASKPAPTTPKPRITPAPKAATKAEEWEEGTILVDNPGRTPMPPVPQPAPAVPEVPAGAYLVHRNREIPITETPFLIGKYNTTLHLHYAIYDNNKVSRNHATILFDSGRYFVRDNQSRNGTKVNGKPVLPLQPAELKDGDEIRLYDEVLVFHLK